MLDALQKLGRITQDAFARTGRGTFFLGKLLPSLPLIFFRPALLIRELYFVGVQTLLIVTVAGLFVGMVLALQAHNVLVDFGAEDSISLMVSLTILRELGPVFTGLLFAGGSDEIHHCTTLPGRRHSGTIVNAHFHGYRYTRWLPGSHRVTGNVRRGVLVANAGQGRFL